MTVTSAGIQSIAQDSSDIGAAGAAALRKVRTLADQAPAGRFFASIATLNELGSETLVAIEKGDMPRAVHAAAKLAKAGEPKLPNFFKKKAKA